MIVSRWITARKQLTNAKRPTIAGNERAPNRALNSARPGRKNILSAPTEAPTNSSAYCASSQLFPMARLFYSAIPA